MTTLGFTTSIFATFLCLISSIQFPIPIKFDLMYVCVSIAPLYIIICCSISILTYIIPTPYSQKLLQDKDMLDKSIIDDDNDNDDNVYKIAKAKQNNNNNTNNNAQVQTKITNKPSFLRSLIVGLRVNTYSVAISCIASLLFIISMVILQLLLLSSITGSVELGLNNVGNDTIK